MMELIGRAFLLSPRSFLERNPVMNDPFFLSTLELAFVD
jgi:hypothetical protein